MKNHIDNNMISVGGENQPIALEKRGLVWKKKNVIVFIE